MLSPRRCSLASTLGRSINLTAHAQRRWSSSGARTNLYAQGHGHEPLTAVYNEQAPQKGIHLYHFAMSICSQKVRMALEEASVPWVSHDVLLPIGEQYHPDYVRLNSRCVVPTLVVDGRVTTDSANIMRYVLSHAVELGGRKIAPHDKAEQDRIDEQSRFVDGLFMEPLTFGNYSARRPSALFRWLYDGRDRYSLAPAALAAKIAQHADDQYLVAAYEGKLQINRGTAPTSLDAARLTALVADADAACARLDAELGDSPFRDGGWLCSADFSLADLHWAAALARFEHLGLPFFTSERAHLCAYAAKLRARPSVVRGLAAYAHAGEGSRPWWFARSVVLPIAAAKLRRRIGI